MLLFVLLCGIAIPSTAQKFNRFNFNVGGGYGGAMSDVGRYADRSYHGVAGGGLNLSRNIGLRAEYMYFNLAFKDSVKVQQSLPDATGRLQSATLNLFWQWPLDNKFSVYAIGGAGWYQRRVEARSQFLPAGTVCQPAWQLWGIECTNGGSGLVDPSQTLSSHTVSAGGYNFGGGFSYRIQKKTRIYVEGRYHHANTSNLTTKVFPVTVGLRW